MTNIQKNRNFFYQQFEHNPSLPTPKNKGQIKIGSTFPKPGTNMGMRQALNTNSSLKGA